MKRLLLIPREDFREWFKVNCPDVDSKIDNLFEDFEYDGKSYLPKRLEKEEKFGRGSS